MPSHYILDRVGNPVPEPDLIKFAQWFESDFKRRVVARTNVVDCEVSTVFLGLDHNLDFITPEEERKPVLWETMIFGGAYDESQWRWDDKEEAAVNHARIVECLRQGGDPNALSF